MSGVEPILFFYVLTRNLTRSSRANLGLVVLEKADKGRNKIVADNVLADALGKADKLVGDHVAHAPAPVRDALAERLQEVGLGLLGREVGRNGDEVGNGEETDRVLVVSRQAAVEGDDVVDEQLVLAGNRGDGLGKGLWVLKVARHHIFEPTHTKGTRGSTADHGRVVSDESRKEAAHLLLGLGLGDGVSRREEGTGRRARREPVAVGQAAEQGHKVLVDSLRGEDARDGRDRLGSLVADERLLNGREVLKRAKDGPGILLSADILYKRAELLGENEEDLILVI